MSEGSLLPVGYLSTSGAQIVDANGNDVRIASVGWNQNFDNIPASVAQIAAAGFNTIRVSFVNATLSQDLPRIEAIVAAAQQNGLKVIIDHHTDENGTPADNYGSNQLNGIWFDSGPGTDGTNGAGVTGTVTQAKFLADWQTVAKTFAGNSTVIGFDLDNEPFEQYGIGTASSQWGGGGLTDIHKMYQDVGNAIEAVDPGALIIAEGPIEFSTLSGADLRGVASNPVVLNVPNKVVYSAHVYPTSIGGSPTDSGPGYVSIQNQSYGYLEAQNIAPVWIGELGASLDGTADSSGAKLADEQAWAQTMTDYLNGKDGAQGGPTFSGNQQGVSTDWWAWGSLPGQYPDGVQNPDGTLNAAQHAIWSQFLYHPTGPDAAASSSASAPPPSHAGPPSADNTVVHAGGSGSITDAAGNAWTITSNGQVAVNGVTDTSTSGVIELAYEKGTVWQENNAKLWWGKTTPSASWSPTLGSAVSPVPAAPTPIPTPTSAIGSGSDTIVLTMSEDADGPAGAVGRDAEFTLNIDGQQIGDLQTVTASHSAGQTQTFTFQGNFAPGAHKATVTFANNSMTGGDKAAFNDGGDRNVYVNSVAYDGATVSSTVTGIYESPMFAPMVDPAHLGNAVFNLTDTTAVPANAPSTPTTSPAPVSVGTGPDTLTLTMSEDRYQTDAQFSVSVDGKLVANTLTASAIEYEGQTQQFQLHGNWGAGPHTVSIAFLNDGTGPADARGTYDSVDRNLFINAVSYNGTVVSNTPWGIFEAGSKSYTVPATASQQPTPTPVPVPTPVPAPVPVPAPTSPQELTVSSGGSLKDTAGNVWTLTSGGTVMENGKAVPGSDGTKAFALVNNVYYGQDASSGQWYTYSTASQSWTSSAAPVLTPQTIPTTIALRVSEDAYLGDAQFTVSVDGKQVGGTYSASALHASGDSNVVTLTSNLTAGAHAVQIQFLNDAYGGTAATDRNLYVNSIAYNGVTQAGSTAALLSNGTSTFNVGGATATGTAPADTLTLHLAQDAYNGNAQFTLSVDGKAVSTAHDVLSQHSAGAWDTVTFAGSFGAGSHAIGVNFTNDLYGGTASTDRNMYVNGIDVNGTHVGSGVTSLLSNGTASFTVTTAH